MLFEYLAVLAVYGGFFLGCAVLTAVVWPLLPKSFTEVSDDE